MDIKVRNWCSSGSRSIHLGRRGYGHLEAADLPAATTGSRRLAIWKLVWRKLMKEKRKMTESSSHSSGHGRGVPNYDVHTYSLNFDEGLVWEDQPDGLSRSFSVQFADPSRIFVNKGVVQRIII